MNGHWNAVEQHLSEIENRLVRFVKKEPVSGGCINQTWKVTDNNGKTYFIKTNVPSLKMMFIAEAHGLNEIKNSNSIRTPHVLAHTSYLNIYHYKHKLIR